MVPSSTSSISQPIIKCIMWSHHRRDRDRERERERDREHRLRDRRDDYRDDYKDDFRKKVFIGKLRTF